MTEDRYFGQYEGPEIPHLDNRQLRDLREDLKRAFSRVEYDITGGGAGWVFVSNIEAQSLDESVSSKVFLDPPANTVLESCTSSTLLVTVTVKASYPKVSVGGTEAVLARVGEEYAGEVDITLPGAGDMVTEVMTPDGVVGAKDTVAIALDLPPQILTLQFTGNYPGSQTELKAGDTFQISGTTDKDCTGVQVMDFGACTLTNFTFPTAQSFLVDAVVADRGEVAVLRPARVRAKSASGAYGPSVDTNAGGGTTEMVHLVKCNNLYPSCTIGEPVYPLTQGALKDNEEATLTVVDSDFDIRVVDSPGGQLTIVDEDEVRVARLAGGYNVSVANFRVTLTRNANDAMTTTTKVVKIADDAAALSNTYAAARMRSGGNNGSVAQNHVVTCTANQQLASAPTFDPDTGHGTWIGSWAGGPSVWTRSLQVHDDDGKGTFSWQAVSATNLAGRVTTTLIVGATYVLGGFVAHTKDLGAYEWTLDLGVDYVTYTKLTATWEGVTAARNPIQGDTRTDLAYGFTMDDANTVRLNDLELFNSNSMGDLTLVIQETV